MDETLLKCKESVAEQHWFTEVKKEHIKDVESEIYQSGGELLIAPKGNGYFRILTFFDDILREVSSSKFRGGDSINCEKSYKDLRGRQWVEVKFFCGKLDHKQLVRTHIDPKSQRKIFEEKAIYTIGSSHVEFRVVDRVVVGSGLVKNKF